MIKAKARDENVRVALAHVNEPSDCATLDLVYHKNCLREHGRKIEQSIANMDAQSQSNIGKYIAAVDILNAVKCSIASGATIMMNDINEAFVSLLSENGVNPFSSDHKKLLKSIISENIEDVKFVKSHRANESEHVVGKKLFGVTVTSESNKIKMMSSALQKQLLF